MSYDYDIFISYKQERDWRDWMEDHFLFNLKEHLEDTLNRHPNIFFDRHTLQAGDPLTARIINALNRSKVCLCILTPGYFKSEWCRKELSIMLRRIELMRNHDLIRGSYRPVIPVCIKDGELYPDLLRDEERQFDLLMFTEIKDRRLALSRLARSHHLATDLAVVLRELVEDQVGPAIISSPEYNSLWEQEDFYRDFYELLLLKDPNVDLPNL